MLSHNLNSNGYLINNEIWISIDSDIQVEYFTLFVQNATDGINTNTFTFYPDNNNNSRVNLQSIMKSIMQGNYAKCTINITSYDTFDNNANSLTLTKDFIRGGNRTNDINQTISPNQRLRISDNIPIWKGYDVTESFLNADFTIAELQQVDIADIDYRRSKGCNNVYLKFMNQKGGWSYWMFESHNETEKASGYGSTIDNDNELLDLGSVSDSKLEVYSKIPKKYKQYANDVVVSHDVRIYDNGKWFKIFPKNNSIEIDNVKKAYAVTFRFDLKYRFNPSLIWSN